MIFILLGYEHSVANMYYIPVGIFAKSIPEYAAASKIAIDAFYNLNWVFN